MREIINTKIYQIEASQYMADENKTFVSLCKGKMTGSLPPSMMLKYIQQQYPQEFKTEIKKDAQGKDIISISTDSIIDVSFKYDLHEKEAYDGYRLGKDGKYHEAQYKPGKLIKNKKQIRAELYTDGLTIDGKHYVCFMRSSSKARQGQCLFVRDYMFDDVLLWCRMGITFAPDEMANIASLRAYESLVMSGTIGTVTIHPDEILLVPDKAPAYKVLASVTEKKGNNLVCAEKEIELTSELYDGESLLDVSVFTGQWEGKGAILLRNKFFKSCAFNTNLQQWFSDNGVRTVTDMFGVEHPAEQIKMITTPNSCKFFKLADKLGGPEKTRKYRMWQLWSDNIDHDFGVCKHEKPTPFEDGRQQMSYQMINSMDISREDVKELASYSLAQIDKVKNDFDYALHFMGLDGDELSISYDMAWALAQVAPDIQHTPLWRNLRDDIAEKLANKLRAGKLLINGDYCIMCSNPMELLKDSVGQPWTEPAHQAYWVYTPLFPDGAELGCFRNPNVSSGNVVAVRNVYNSEIGRYLNLTPNVVVVTGCRSDMMARLSGADVDSDSILLTDNPIIVRAARECMGRFRTPINYVPAKVKKRPYNLTSMAEVDALIAENAIGQICNLAQVFLSYYWDYQSKGADEQLLQKIYSGTSALNALSQIEIDRAKKLIQGLSSSGQMLRIARMDARQDELDKLKQTKQKVASALKNNENIRDDIISGTYHEALKQMQKLGSTDKAAQRKIKSLEKKTNPEYYHDIMKKITELQTEKQKLEEQISTFKHNPILQKVEAKKSRKYVEDLNDKKNLEKTINALVCPRFAEKVFNQGHFTEMNCPMDYVYLLPIPRAKTDKNKISMDEFFRHAGTKMDTNNKANRRHTAQIRKICDAYIADRQQLCAKYNFEEISYDDYAEYKDNSKRLLDDTITELQGVGVTRPETIMSILKAAWCAKSRAHKEEDKGKRRTITSLLYKAYPLYFLACFGACTDNQKVSA